LPFSTVFYTLDWESDNNSVPDAPPESAFELFYCFYMVSGLFFFQCHIWVQHRFMARCCRSRINKLLM